MFQNETVRSILKWQVQLIGTAMLIGCVAVLAHLHGRSATLRNVRNLDQALVKDLARILVLSDAASNDAVVKDQMLMALNRLKSPTKPQPFMGVALWKNGNLILSTHPKLEDRLDSLSIKSQKDKRLNIAELGKSRSGDEWAIGFFRSELRYDLENNLKLYIPVLQSFDKESMDVKIDVYKRHGIPVFGITFLAIYIALFAFTGFYRYWKYRDRMRLNEMTNLVSNLIGKLSDRQKDIDLLETKAKELDQRRNQTQKQLELQVHITEQQKKDLEDQYEEALTDFSIADDERKKAEQQAENLRVELEKLTQAYQRQQEKLSGGKQRTDFLSPLGFKHEWHPDAIKGSAYLYKVLKEGQKRLFTKYLIGVYENSDPFSAVADGLSIEKMSEIDEGVVYHNPGRMPFKLYWTWLRDGTPYILAAELTDSKHQTDAFINQLRKRISGLNYEPVAA